MLSSRSLDGKLLCSAIALAMAMRIGASHADTLPGAQSVVEAAKYPSLQAAIDAVPRTGGMLRLPPGELVITEPLIIQHEDFRMEGAGTATHIKNTNTSGKPAIVIRSEAFDDKVPTQRKPLWRVTLSSFRVTGNDQSGRGIEADHINELFIQGLTISNHGSDGIYAHFCYEDMRLSDSLITYNRGAGLRAQGNHDSLVSACQFEENLDGVVFIDGFNLTLSGNNIDDHLRHGVVIENSMGSLVSANMIEQCNGTGLVLARDTYGTTVSGNLFAQNFGGAVDLRDAHGIPITGNTFVRCKQFGVRVSTNSGRSTINGNIFCDTFDGVGPRQSGPRTGNPDVNEAAGILLEATRDITITGNLMSGLVTRPYTEIEECDRIIYEHNHAVDCADVDAKITKVLGTGASAPRFSVDGELQIVTTMRDESALARTHDIEVRDGIAYLAGKGGSLAIVDVNQPAVPKLLWSVLDPSLYEDAETVLPLDERQLLVGTRDLFLFDVAHADQPKRLKSIQDREQIDSINGFARFGDVIFGANKQGRIIAIDVATSDTISLLGARETRMHDRFSSPHDAVFCDELLVVVSPEGFGARGSRLGKLGVYRVVDPTTQKVLPAEKWMLIGLYEHPRLAGANRVRARGKMLYVGSALSYNIDRTDDLRCNVSMIDLSDPNQPKLRGSLDFPDLRGPNGLEIVGSVVFAAGGQTVQAIDISNPVQPCELGRITASAAFPGGADDAHDLAYHDGHPFVTAQNSHSLVIVKVGDVIRRGIDR